MRLFLIETNLCCELRRRGGGIGALILIEEFELTGIDPAAAAAAAAAVAAVTEPNENDWGAERGDFFVRGGTGTTTTPSFNEVLLKRVSSEKFWEL